jgi:hypothetical protein
LTDTFNQISNHALMKILGIELEICVGQLRVRELKILDWRGWTQLQLPRLLKTEMHVDLFDQ